MAVIKDRKLTAPVPNPETEAFWKAAEQGRLLIGRCRDTGKAYFFPRALSPFTLSNNIECIEASGRGTIYSFSYMARAPEPFAIAYVELEEGPMVLTNIVDCDSDALRIGMSVRLVFKPSDGGPPAPMFTPA
jgi:uncharacterized OB-fold protein